MGKYIEVNGISDVVELNLVHDCTFMPYLSLTDCTKYYMCIKLSYTIYVEYDNCMCSKPFKMLNVTMSRLFACLDIFND